MHFVIPNWLADFGHRLVFNRSESLTLLILIVAIILLSFLINYILVNSIGGIYRIFVAPGIIVHELSHAFGCMITGAKIHSINVFKKDGGEVRHERPRIPIIGQIIVSLAPFAIGALAIYLIANAVGVRTVDAANQAQFLHQPVQAIWQMIKSIDFTSLRSWLAFYLIISIAVTMTPSAQDLRNIYLSLIAVIVIIYVLIKYLGVHMSLGFLLRPELVAIIGSCVIVLIAALILSIVIAVMSGLVKR